MSYTNTGDFVRVIKGGHRGGGFGRSAEPVTIAYNMDTSHKTDSRNYFRITVRLLGSLIDELGWKPGEYVDVHEGTGASAGKLLLVPAERPDTGYKLSVSYNGPPHEAARRRSAGVTPHIYIGIGTGGMRHHSTPTDASIMAVPVKYRPFNNELLIDMPSWFKPLAASAPEPQEYDDEPVVRRRGRPRKQPHAE
jgi:hypothetical protein